MTRAPILLICLAVTAAGASIAINPLADSAPLQTGKVIALPDGDRALIEQYFGDGVVGDALPARSLNDPAALLNLQKHAELKYRFVRGNSEGQIHDGGFVRLTRIDDKPIKWRFADGVNDAIYGRITESGSAETTSSISHAHGVVSRYSPGEPMIPKGLEAGEMRSMEIAVSVYDLSDEENRKYSGHLDVEFSYIGAYRVTTPAGAFDAVLLRWRYSGKVGPAKVQDFQYWFIASGVGPVAMIQRTDVSAFLVYHEHDKSAAVLIERP